MWTIIITILVCLILGVLFRDELDASIMGSIAIGLLLGFLIADILGLTNLSKKEIEWRQIETTNIASLADGTKVEGHFTLGSGTIEGKPCYVYYVGNNINGYQIDRLLAQGVIIKEENNCIPRIVVSGYKRTKPFYKSFYSITALTIRETTIYVPKGTIIRNYVLDSNL